MPDIPCSVAKYDPAVKVFLIFTANNLKGKPLGCFSFIAPEGLKNSAK
jgi:hypothetical protein